MKPSFVLFGIIACILLIVLLNVTESFGSSKLIFKTPKSLTNLKASPSSGSKKRTKGKNLLSDGELCKKMSYICNSNMPMMTVKSVNILQMPSYFSAGEKWPGCLPRPLYQGSCGSCWGFASVTCLSSRFYIESCSTGSCDTYPQLNFGSVTQVYENLNESYGFRKIVLDDIFKFIDVNKDNIIDQKEWLDIVKQNRKKIFSKDTSAHDKYLIVQILVFMLDFQSLGSVNLGSEVDVMKRAKETFEVWRRHLKSDKPDQLDIHKLKQLWNSEPLMLSVEKVVSCCIKCMSQGAKNQICKGGTLDDAWVLLRDTGTPTSMCIGYNMDNYSEGDPTPTCRESQGPFYSFCTGFIFEPEDSKKLMNVIKKYEKKEYPVAIKHNDDVPWSDPQLIRFRAKNAYKLKNNLSIIQNELLTRGPITTGFVVYSDFQNVFAQSGLGGQKFTQSGKLGPLGGHQQALIYMHDPEVGGEQIGGHAITIVGWGVFRYTDNTQKVYNIPYWICLNSYGVKWGHSGFPHRNDRHGPPERLDGGGYFWMIRGLNNCEIESNITVGQPDISNITYPGIIDQYGWGMPPPDEKDVTFLPQLDYKSFDLGQGTKLKLDVAERGGGLYTYFNRKDNMWELKSQNPPSVYNLFWSKNRPLYCLGELTHDLDSKLTDNVIKISPKMYELLKKAVARSPTPLLLLGQGSNKEQIQLVRIGPKQIQVNRAVNYNKLIKHPKGTLIKIFPYGNLYVDFFKENKFPPCSNSQY